MDKLLVLDDNTATIIYCPNNCILLNIIVKKLIRISKRLSEIKTDLEILTTKHDYLEERVKKLENINFNKNKTY